MHFISFKGKDVLTMKQLSELFDVNSKTLTKNFQRNKEKYIEGEHYYILTGPTLKSFKQEHKELDLKFVSILYLWTKPGITLLSKSNGSDFSWEFLNHR